MPVTNNPTIPPITAIGMTLMARTVSITEPKLNQISMAISARLIGTTTDKPLDRILQIAEFADPFDPLAGRQLHLGGDLLLRFLDGAAKVALADART